MEPWHVGENQPILFSEFRGPLYWGELELDILATMPPRHHGLYRWDGSECVDGDVDAQLDRCFVL